MIDYDENVLNYDGNDLMIDYDENVLNYDEND